MRTSSPSTAQKKTALTAGAVGVGLAGAVAGAAVGVAFADEKTRRKIYKMAVNAQDSLMKLVDTLELADSPTGKKAQDMVSRTVRSKAKNSKRLTA
jgi:hypothetical protein